jgi:hypothetical protein
MEADPFFDAVEMKSVPHQAPMILEAIKQEAHEMANEQAELLDIGVLRTPENSHLWNNSEKTISLARRLESGEITEAELQEAEGRLNEAYIAVSKGAPKRCIDGSTLEGYDDTNPEHYGRPLGPQIQGGIADEAYAMRLTKGLSAEPNATLLTDIEIVASEHSADFAPGDHTDNVNHGNPDNTGCGAVNGMEVKTERILDEETSDFAHGVTTTVLGIENIVPDESALADLRTRAAELRDKPGYFPEHVAEVLKKITELYANGIEKLVRPHNEAFLVINFVRGTTLHRDHFNAATDSKIQAFSLDAWYIIDEYGEEGYALVMDAVLTAMNLTDGSLRVKARLPKRSDFDLIA